METKTHWRKPDKTDFLGAADLEDLLPDGKNELVLTIQKVEIKDAKVRGAMGTFRIATFAEKGIKPMILNVTNAKVVKRLCGNSMHVEDWKNVKIVVYIQQNVKFGSDITEALRIKPFTGAPKQLPDLNPDHPKWAGAKKSLADGNTTIAAIREHYTLSPENEILIQA